ncbi:hypothetical protein D3C81_2024860 [compost metagenome]
MFFIISFARFIPIIIPAISDAVPPPCSLPEAMASVMLICWYFCRLPTISWEAVFVIIS